MKKLLFKIFNIEFYLTREYEIKEEEGSYTVDEALNIAKNKIIENIEKNGSKISEIMNEKYLKKNRNNDKLDIELFLAVKEQIGVEKYYNVEMSREPNDKEYFGDFN